MLRGSWTKNSASDPNVCASKLNLIVSKCDLNKLIGLYSFFFFKLARKLPHAHSRKTFPLIVPKILVVSLGSDKSDRDIQSVSIWIIKWKVNYFSNDFRYFKPYQKIWVRSQWDIVIISANCHQSTHLQPWAVFYYVFCYLTSFRRLNSTFICETLKKQIVKNMVL